MTRVRLEWDDENYGEEEHRVYRGDAPLDTQSMPAPLVVVGAGVTEYSDDTVVEGQTYHYIVSAIVNGQEYFSDPFSITADTPDVLLNGLVMLHDMEFISGTTLEDAFGTHHGTIYGATSVPGVVGQALAFDGNDRVEVPDDPELDIGDEDFSISMWVKLNSFAQNKAMLTKTTAFDDNAVNYAIDQGIGSGVNEWRFRTGGGPTGYVGSAARRVTGEWVFLVAVYQEGGAGELWVDGALEGSTSNLPAPTPNSGKLYIGSYYTSSGMDGQLDQVRIYKRALSAQDIALLYAEGSP